MDSPLQGKRGLILGVSNKNSIAWSVAQTAHNLGADVAITVQNERFAGRVSKLLQDSGMGNIPLWTCDIMEPSTLDALVEQVQARWDRLDFILHGWAFAPREALSGAFIDTTWEDYQVAHRVSAHSLVEVTRRFRPLMGTGGSIVTLSYLGSQRAVPGYNVMGVAKAALEASVRYLAHDLGPAGIRINALSPGPINTLSARGVSGFSGMLQEHAQRAPLQRNVEADEVGSAAAFLFSPWSSGITGEVIYVDAGYRIMGV